MQTGNPQTDSSQAKQARREAVCRQWRVIFNDDSHELSHQGANTVQGFLAPRLTPLVATHVDAIS